MKSVLVAALILNHGVLGLEVVAGGMLGSLFSPIRCGAAGGECRPQFRHSFGVLRELMDLQDTRVVSKAFCDTLMAASFWLVAFKDLNIEFRDHATRSETNVRFRRNPERTKVVVAAYYDLTGDEVAERVPVHHLYLSSPDPSISRLPVLTVPALDSG